MRKRIITPTSQVAPHLDVGWLNLDRAAVVEVTSDDKEHPVESALVRGETRGSSSKKARQSVPKSSSCDGLRMAGARFEKSCVSSGISVPALTQYARSKNIELNSPMSRFLNRSVPDISRGAARASLKSLRLS